MAKRTLNIVIDCGEKTCASAPGVFCGRLLTTRMGTKWVCGAFLDEQCNNIELHEDHEYGWLQRCDQCLEAEENCKPQQEKSWNENETHRGENNSPNGL